MYYKEPKRQNNINHTMFTKKLQNKKGRQSSSSRECIVKLTRALILIVHSSVCARCLNITYLMAEGTILAFGQFVA